MNVPELNAAADAGQRRLAPISSSSDSTNQACASLVGLSARAEAAAAVDPPTLKQPTGVAPLNPSKPRNNENSVNGNETATSINNDRPIPQSLKSALLAKYKTDETNLTNDGEDGEEGEENDEDVIIFEQTLDSPAPIKADPSSPKAAMANRIAPAISSVAEPLSPVSNSNALLHAKYEALGVIETVRASRTRVETEPLSPASAVGVTLNEDSESSLFQSRDLRDAKYEALGAPNLDDSLAAAPDDLSQTKYRQLNVLKESKEDEDHERDEEAAWDPPLSDQRGDRPFDVFAEAIVVGDANTLSPFALPLQSVDASAVDKTPMEPPWTTDDLSSREEKSKDESKDDSLVSLSRTETKSMFRQWVWPVAALILLAGIAATALVCGTGGCKPKPSTAETAAPTTSDIAPTRESILMTFINEVSLTGRTIDAPENATNDDRAEDRALAWLLYNDAKQLGLDETSLSQFNLLQRYAMATLWIRMVDDVNLIGHECEWEGVTCRAFNASSDEDTAQLVVTEIDIVEAEWKGTLSADLGHLSHLERFNLFDNSMTGTLPDSIGRWSNLKHFCICDNAIMGELPESIGLWTDLTVLNIFINQISGTMPTSVGQWTNLETFHASSNALKGPLPESIGAWSNLLYFNIAANKFTGSFPNGIARWTALEYFDLDSNKMTGTLPSAQWSHLTFFNCEFNQLSGTIPLSVANWTSIQDAFFYENDFTGTVPGSICDGVNLTLLWADCLSEVTCGDCCTECF